ncbi:MAG: homoserine kinase [Rhodospirillales bacterium]|nr:homoserine kinase [Rhodospirillales bacterium]
MAVYTEIPDEELEAFLDRYALGKLQSIKGIAEGIENSNYLLGMEQGTFILTIYEKRVEGQDLPFYLNLMEHLASEGVPCPVPVKGQNGQTQQTLCDKPAALVSFLNGVSPRRVLPDHCTKLGQGIASFHVAGKTFNHERKNTLSVDKWRPLFEQCAGVADQLEKEIARELNFLEENWPRSLPKGIIHGDLFPDNAFFLDNKLSGIIDLYFACTDALAYDLGVCLNAWCFEKDGAFNISKARSLLSGYNKVRPLSADETNALPILARGAALRFLLTRLYDWTHTPDGPMTRRKDPMEYWQKLKFHHGVNNPSGYGL